MASAETVTATKPSTVQDIHSKSVDMVGVRIMTKTGTPPQSPRHNFHSTVSTALVQPSPFNHRRASYHVEPSNTKSPGSANRRSSLPVEATKQSPLGSRPQPATAAAPVLGRHENKDLAGFDPLFEGELPLSPPRFTNRNHDSLRDMMDVSNMDLSNREAWQQPPATPTSFKGFVIPASSSNLSVSPPTPPTQDAKLAKELRKLAKDLSAASPHRPPTSKSDSAKPSKPKFGRATSLTPLFNLTPPFRVSVKTVIEPDADIPKEPLSAPHRKLPWQRHRRSQSLETPNGTSQAVTTRNALIENDAAAGNKVPVSPITPMMQDLYDVVKAQQAMQDTVKLTLPSLFKPAPTSFLTGHEIVRTSEQDPSPFQMEIPNLVQTLVAARSVQFVDVYRKEDLNFDVKALVNLPRVDMQAFVENPESAPPNNRLTQAHRPIVESLLEAADDATVAGFFTTANDSADARREVVIFERQMQFVVAFRGTTQEQMGKTPFFKKKDKNALEPLSRDSEHCKVYASVKQAYMDLEQRVFECLDNFLDQNPFCDVVFTGSSMGGAMATMGAFRYATNRPMVRVCCQTFGAPKVGNSGFRQLANSLPNLKVMRIEYGNDPKCFAPHDVNGAHVGHAILLAKTNETTNVKTLSVVASKFDNHDSRKNHSSKSATILASFKKERDIMSYVSHLEQLHQSKVNKWVKNFAGEDGTGVRGKDNEKRTVV